MNNSKRLTSVTFVKYEMRELRFDISFWVRLWMWYIQLKLNIIYCN